MKKRITDKMRLNHLTKIGQNTIERHPVRGWCRSGKDYIIHAELGQSLRDAIDGDIRRNVC